MSGAGLTVAALAGEAAKAGAGAAGSKPTDDQGAAEVEERRAGGASVQGEGADADAQTASGEAAGGEGEAGGLAPEVQALVDSQVKAAVEALRDEYEGKGGHLSKLRSKLEASTISTTTVAKGRLPCSFLGTRLICRLIRYHRNIGLYTKTRPCRFGQTCNRILLRRTQESICWDKYDVEFFGLVKADILGLTALDKIR